MLCLVGGQGAGKSSFFQLLAMNDEWFSDDLKKLDDDKVYRKLVGHWIMEMSEMIGAINAKSVEEIKSFMSRRKETYKDPYAIYPSDRPRQTVFCGATNRDRFLPFDRTGNRRFLPIRVDEEKSEVYVLENEAESRKYLEQVWAEAMVIYHSGDYQLKFSAEMEKQLILHRQDFMEEDTMAGMIQGWLDAFKGDHVCSLMLFREFLDHPNDKPKKYETNEIGEIMNTSIHGWKPGPQHRFPDYGQ